MKTTKRDRPAAQKTDRKLYTFNDETVSKNEDNGEKQKERFDKNSLSEYDLDKIQAII